jgi:hypothetical protein
MARTSTGALLTAQHRRGQLAIRARALQDFIRLWPLWRGDRRSYGDLVTATLPLVQVHNQLSASFAGAYYQAFRTAEGVGGATTPFVPGPINRDRVVSSLYVTGEVMTGKAIAAGISPQAAQQIALTRVSGAVGRHVLQGGRDTLVRSTGQDRRAKGWGRVTGDNACDFCEELAGRGAVYRGQDTAEFEAHDHCACMAEPGF